MRKDRLTIKPTPNRPAMRAPSAQSPSAAGSSPAHHASPKDDCSCACSAWAHALPRWGLAALFLVAAYKKITHPENWASYLPKFDGVLPAVLLKPFFAALPWVELFLGALLLLGLFTRGALKLAGILLLTLLFGALMIRDFAVSCQNFVYLCAAAALLATAKFHTLGLDRFRKCGDHR